MLSLKLLKQIIGRNLSIKDFFTSGEFKNHLSGIVKMVARRYGDNTMSVSLAWGGDSVAYTDNHKVFINLNNPIVQPINETETRYLTYLGFLGHELGHVLYTDFQQYKDGIEGKDVSFGVPKKYSSTVKDIQQYRKGIAKAAIEHIYADLINIVEDGYVNFEIKRAFPGTFADGIKTCHEYQFSRESKLLEYDIANVTNACLQAFVKGKVDSVFLSKYPVLKEIEEIAQDITVYPKQKDRVGLTNYVFVLLWPIIKDNLDEAIEEFQNGQNNGQGNSGKNEEGKQGQGSGGSSGGASSSGNTSSGVGKGGSSAGRGSIEDLINALKNGQVGRSSVGSGTGVVEQQRASQGNNEASDDNGSMNNQNSSDNAASNENRDSSSNNQVDSDKDENEVSGATESKDSPEENAEQEDTQDNTLSSDETDSGEEGDVDADNGEAKEPFDEGDFDDAVSEQDLLDALSKLVDEFITNQAKDMAKNNPEKAESLINSESAANIAQDASSVHRGYPYEIRRAKVMYDQSRYGMSFSSLAGISKRLQKRVSTIIEDSVDGGVNKNLLKGNKIVPAASAKGDGKIFKRKNLPETHELAVSVLLDQSGSMYGMKIQKCREMAMLIEDFCAGLNIPVSITGHSENGGVILDEYVTFEDTSKNRKLKLLNISAGGCNRDGFALRYCMDILDKRPEEKKIMILVSDGLPNSNNYSGASAARDLTSIKNEYQKKGIFLIAAAIDDDKERIRDIYGNSFLDISDITNLPIKMASIISRFYTD